jgi:protein-S-isoprenylcysteine O-methyltransferase Ste14
MTGEALRIWAAGHLEKSREVTQSGPYRWTRHPLYVGSSIIGAGFALAAWHPVVALVAALYLGTTIPAAIRAEEAHLRDKFGDAYDAYASQASTPVVRAFSIRRALFNREHHTLAGLLAVMAVLALKALWSGA